MVTLDLEEDGRQNLHCPAVWGYLLGLAERGLVRAVIGGPPCRTTSRLRHSQPGPIPLHGREEPRLYP